MSQNDKFGDDEFHDVLMDITVGRALEQFLRLRVGRGLDDLVLDVSGSTKDWCNFKRFTTNFDKINPNDHNPRPFV